MRIQGNNRRGGADAQKAVLPRRVAGFSLIEMLVVIAVIAILAALFLGAMPAISDKKIRSSVRAELKRLTTEIEAYKVKHGFYPPDNPNNIAHPPLFYELVGTIVSNDTFYPLNGAPALTSQQVNDNFGAEGFMNSSPNSSDVKNFLTQLRDRQFDASPYGSAGALALKVPADGPKDPAKPLAERTNTWRYVVAKPNRGAGDPYPTNNPNTFDLWADVVIRGRTVTIGNWKEE